MIVVAIVAFAVAYRFVDPAPPRSVTVATGPETGRYRQVGQRLARRLAQKGLTVTLVESSGSIENLDLLTTGERGVTLAFVQSGVENLYGADTEGLRGLGALYYEPLWIFHRRDQPIEVLPDIHGRRLAVGEPGSGTMAVARLLLESSGITAAEARSVALSEIGGEEAAKAIENGGVDVAFFVQSADSPIIQRLARNPSLDFVSVRRAEAYQRHYPFLSSCSIPAGLLDLARDIPEDDRVVLAPAATLVVNEQFHPALTPLILEAARDVVGAGGVLERAGEFPAAKLSSFPLTAEAEHYYRQGPPFLMRYLPFWAASLVDRLIILVVPLLVVIVPLARLAGPIYQWRVRSKIYRWYGYLQETDEKIRDGSIRDELDSQIERLRKLEIELTQVQVPLSYMDQLYDVHLHVGHALERLRALKEATEQQEATEQPPT
jgi:TRAP transporter TAXI family solute receptor